MTKTASRGDVSRGTGNEDGVAVFQARWKRVGARGLGSLPEVNLETWTLSEFLNIAVLSPESSSNPFSCRCLVLERYTSLDQEPGATEVAYLPLNPFFTLPRCTGNANEITPTGTSSKSSTDTDTDVHVVREVFLGQQWLTAVHMDNGTQFRTQLVFQRWRDRGGTTPAKITSSRQPDLTAMWFVSADGLLVERIKQAGDDHQPVCEKLFQQLSHIKGNAPLARPPALFQHSQPIKSVPGTRQDQHRLTSAGTPELSLNATQEHVWGNDESVDNELVFSGIAADLGLEGLEKISPLSVVEEDRYNNFKRALNSQMQAVLGYGNEDSGFRVGKISAHLLQEILSGFPCSHLNINTTDILQDLALRRSRLSIEQDTAPSSIELRAMLAWLHNELCLRELFQICQRCPPGHMTSRSPLQGPTVRKQLLTTAVEGDLQLCAQLSRCVRCLPDCQCL